MSLQLLQIQTFECSVCKQLYDEEKLRSTTQVKVIFGAKAYAVCPCCQMEVRSHKNRAYRKRAKLWIESHQEGQ